VLFDANISGIGLTPVVLAAALSGGEGEYPKRGVSKRPELSPLCVPLRKSGVGERFSNDSRSDSDTCVGRVCRKKSSSL